MSRARLFHWFWVSEAARQEWPEAIKGEGFWQRHEPRGKNQKEKDQVLVTFLEPLDLAVPELILPQDFCPVTQQWFFLPKLA